MKPNNRVCDKNTPNIRKFPNEINPKVKLEPKHIAAIKLIAQCEDLSVLDLYEAWIESGIESSHATAAILSVEGDAAERENALKFLPRLNALLGPPKTGRLPRPCIQNAKELENAVVAATAFIQLLFEAIGNEKHSVFARNNRHLAAGVQELMWKVQTRLQTAADGLHIGYLK